MKILKNVYILYAVFLFSLLNIGWFVYYNNYNSLIAFITCCLTVYLINHNMILVLGISMIVVNILNMFNLVKIVNNTQGFREGVAFNNNAWQNQIKDETAKLRKIEEAKLQKEIDTEKKRLEVALAKVRSESNNQSSFESFKNKDKKEADDSDDSDDSDDDDSDDEKTKYMQDKSIIKKIKKLDPIITDVLMNMDRGHINAINQTLNHIIGKNKVDN